MANSLRDYNRETQIAKKKNQGLKDEKLRLPTVPTAAGHPSSS